MDITRTKQGFQALRQAIADQEEQTSIQLLLSINQAFADQEFRQKKSLFDEVRSMLDMPQFEEERNRYTMRDNNTKFNLYLDQARRAVASILQNDAISALDDEMDYAMDDDAMDDDDAARRRGRGTRATRRRRGRREEGEERVRADGAIAADDVRDAGEQRAKGT